MSKVRRRFNEKYFCLFIVIFSWFLFRHNNIVYEFSWFYFINWDRYSSCTTFSLLNKNQENYSNCFIFTFWRILKTSIFVSYVGGICSWFSQSESVIDIHHNQNLVRSGGKVVFLLSWKWVLRCFTPESKFAILLQSKSYEKFMNGIIHTSPSSFKSLDILLFRKNEIGAHPLFS